MTTGYHPLVKRLLDGELSRVELPPERDGRRPPRCIIAHCLARQSRLAVAQHTARR